MFLLRNSQVWLWLYSSLIFLEITALKVPVRKKNLNCSLWHCKTLFSWWTNLKSENPSLVEGWQFHGIDEDLSRGLVFNGMAWNCKLQ